MDVSEYLGPLLFVRVQKWHCIQDDAWFCNWISVKGPGDQGAEYRFPYYRWVQDTNILSLPEGTGEQRGGVCEGKLSLSCSRKRRQPVGTGAWRPGFVCLLVV